MPRPGPHDDIQQLSLFDHRTNKLLYTLTVVSVTLMPASSSGLLTDLLAAQPQKREGGPPVKA